MPDEDSNLD